MKKNDDLGIISVGSSVNLTGDVMGVIISINIKYNNHITYECSWWNGRNHETKWIEEFELTKAAGQDKTTIGFL